MCRWQAQKVAYFQPQNLKTSRILHKQHFLSRVKPTWNNYIPFAVQERIKIVHNRHGIRGGFCCNHCSSRCGGRSLYPEKNLPRWWPTISEVWPTFCLQRGSSSTDGRGKIANRTTCHRWNTAKKLTDFHDYYFFASIKSSRLYFSTPSCVSGKLATALRLLSKSMLTALFCDLF